MAKKKTGQAEPVGTSPVDPQAPAPAGGPVLNLIQIIQDVRALVAAVKAGNWFGPGGALDLLAELIGLVNTANTATDDAFPVFSAGSESASVADLEAALAELRAACTAAEVPSMPAAAKIAGTATQALSPQLVLTLLEAGEQAVEWFIDYWKRTHPAT